MKCNALIVDDQDDVLLLMRVIIDTADEGLAVRGQAHDGAEALAQVDAVDPDVVVLDEMMPGLTGIETARAIRSMRPDQKMIMCTARLDDDVRRRASEAGIAVCLSKADIRKIPEALQRLSAS